MNNLFKDILQAEESLFINSLALDYDYLPKLLPFREDNQFYLASCLKPLFNNHNGKNILVSGKPGIGKTAACKFVLRDLEQETDKIKPIYINCWKKDTAHKIALEICSQLKYKWTHNKNTDTLLKEITTILNNNSAVFVFDEVDKLENEQIIYSLLEDINRKAFILITNETHWISEIDDRVRSRLLPDHIEFKPYNYEETKEILKQRIEYAFVQGVWDSEALILIAEKTNELKDIRAGLYLLRETGNIAEMDSSRKISVKHAEKAISNIDKIDLKKKFLNNEDKTILEIIKSNPEKSTTDIYLEYKKKFDKSQRTFQRRLKNLANSNLIEMIEKYNHQKGGKEFYALIK